MSEVASENVILDKENLEETSVNLEEIKSSLEEISKKVQNVESQLSEEQDNIGNILESIGEIHTKISATENMLVESPKGDLQTKQNHPISFFVIAFIIVFFLLVGYLMEWLSDQIECFVKWIYYKTQQETKKIPKDPRVENKKYENLSAEDIFKLFRNNYKEKDTKWIIIILAILMNYIIIIITFSIFVEYFPDNMYLCSLLIVGYAFSCLVALSKKKSKTTPNLSVLVLSIWSVILYFLYSNNIRLTDHIVFVINSFFYPTFLLSNIHFEYTNFEDSSLRNAHQTINKIIEENGIAKAQSSFDILVTSSSKIEDEFIMDIKKLIYILATIFATLFATSVIKDFINAYINALIGNSTFDDIVSVILSLIMILPIFYFLYKAFNWKADLYKKVLKDMQFTYKLKGKLDYDKK
jgi:membrane protein